MSEQQYCDAVAVCVHTELGESRPPSTIAGAMEHEDCYRVAMHILDARITVIQTMMIV